MPGGHPTGNGKEEALLGKIIRIGLTAGIVAILFAGWHSYRASAVGPSSFRQIYIHETPVCVFQEGEDVLARIGLCPDTPDGEKDDLPGRAPFHGRPRMELPPGHPPVGEGDFTEERRTIPI